MKVLVVGGGGREHAIIRKLKESPRRPALYAAPGNGGIASDAVCVPIAATDVAGVVSFAVQEGIDYVVVAPDDPLVLGMVDALAEKGIPAFGPNKAAAILEGSKVFSKNLMKKYGIPTAAYETFADAGEAAAYVRANRSTRLSSRRIGLRWARACCLRGRGRGAGRCEKHHGGQAVRRVGQPYRHRGVSHGAGGFCTQLYRRENRRAHGVQHGPQARAGRRQGPEHRRHGHHRAQPLLYAADRTGVHGDDFQTHRCGHERGGPALQRLFVFRADAYARRPEGH